LGLQRAPFLSHIDNTFYYAYPSFAQRLQMLTHLIKGSDFLVLVIGEQDSGKTTLLNQFLASTDNKWRGCKIRAYSKTKSNNAPLFENLDNHPAFILSDENLPIVMLDDAHKLTDIELQFLLQEALAPGSMDKLKRLVLFCEPSIQAVMAALTTPIAEETVVNKVYISSISEAETAEYMLHRLKIAGFKGKNPFRPSHIKSIYRASGGLPGKINEEAHKSLVQKYSRNSNSHIVMRISNFLATRPFHLAIGGIILLTLVLFLLFNGRTNSYFSSQDLSEMVKKPQELSTMQEFSVPGKSNNKSEQVSIIVKEKEPELIPLSTDVPIKEFNEDKKGVKTEERILNGIHGESWILAQPSSYYTIQILGVGNEKSILNFVKQYRLWNKVSYFQTVYKGKKWFPLFYRVYSTKKEALSAVKELPEDIHKLTPWIRSISSVQAEIKENIN